MSIIPYGDMIGHRFKEGGRSLDTGLDCFGLLMECHARTGKTIPDFRSPIFHHEIAEALASEKQSWLCHWEKSEGEFCPLTECQPGRSLLLEIKGLACHVGFVHRPGWFLHAWEKTSGVTEERISLWKRKVIGVYEFVD